MDMMDEEDDVLLAWFAVAMLVLIGLGLFVYAPWLLH